MSPKTIALPKHYAMGDFVTLDVTEDLIQFYTPIEAFHVGQIMKYLYRAPHKGSKLVDLKKAQFFLNRLVDQQ